MDIYANDTKYTDILNFNFSHTIFSHWCKGIQNQTILYYLRQQNDEIVLCFLMFCLVRKVKKRIYKISNIITSRITSRLLYY